MGVGQADGGDTPIPVRLDSREQVASAGASLYLGKLKQAKGGQTYDLPKGKDPGMYTTLLVWSKKKKRAVASAERHPTSGGMTVQPEPSPPGRLAC